jgi:hypothetical protein
MLEEGLVWDEEAATPQLGYSDDEFNLFLCPVSPARRARSRVHPHQRPGLVE